MRLSGIKWHPLGRGYSCEGVPRDLWWSPKERSRQARCKGESDKLFSWDEEANGASETISVLFPTLPPVAGCWIAFSVSNYAPSIVPQAQGQKKCASGQLGNYSI